MKIAFCSLAILALLFCIACTAPNYDYKVDAPAGWRMYDTTMNGLKIRMILGPNSLTAERPAANIIIASMEGRDIDEFTVRNMNYLEKNTEGVTILENGSIDASAISARWFTYTLEQNGIKRELVNYIIPINDFAYMITGGVTAGYMNKYRPIFDNIAHSFRE